MEKLTLAFSFLLDPEHKIIEIDHIDCEICPTVHYLGRPVFDVLTGSKNSDATGYSGSARIEGSIPCMYAVQDREENVRVSVFTPNEDESVRKSGKVMDMKRLASQLRGIEKGTFVCCVLRPLRLNSPEKTEIQKKNGYLFLLESVLECFGSPNFMMAPVGYDVVLALPFGQAHDIDMLCELLREKASNNLSYDPDIRWGVAQSNSEDDPYLIIKNAEDALALALETEVTYHTSMAA